MHDAKTDETVEYTDELPLEDGQPFTWLWEHGNYGCDCNRFLFWERAHGREPEQDFECSRSAPNQWSVRLVDGAGSTVYEDGAFERSRP
jgi:hypothetical protein